MELSELLLTVTAFVIGLAVISILTSYMVYKMKSKKKSSIKVFPGIKIQKNFYTAAEYKAQNKVHTITMSDNYSAVPSLSASAGVSLNPSVARVIDFRYS